MPAIDRVLSLRPPVEHILIETSGLALPKPLVQAFQWPSVKSRVTVDGIVAVIDGAALADGRVAADPMALEAQRSANPSLDHDDPVEEVFEDQIACADLVILSKSDLLDEAGRERADAAIDRHVGRAVKVVPTVQGRIDPSVLLGLGLAVEEDIDNRRTHHDDELDHEHDEFDSFVIELPPVADPDELARRNVTGNIAAPMDWADFLVWKTDGRLKPLFYSHVHLAGEQARQDYSLIFRGDPAWLDKLREHQMQFVAVSRQRNPELMRAVLLDARGERSVHGPDVRIG